MDMVARHAVGKGYERDNRLGQGRTALYFLVSASHEQHLHTAESLQQMLTAAGFVNATAMPGYVMATKPATRPATTPAIA